MSFFPLSLFCSLVSLTVCITGSDYFPWWSCFWEGKELSFFCLTLIVEIIDYVLWKGSVLLFVHQVNQASGRVYILKFNSDDRKFFFWMQVKLLDYISPFWDFTGHFFKTFFQTNNSNNCRSLELKVTRRYVAL